MAADLADILSQVSTVPGIMAQGNAQLAQAGQQIGVDNAGITQATQTAQRDFNIQGTSQAIIDSTADAAKAKALENSAQYASFLGNNLGNNSSAMRQMADSYLSETNAALAARQQIAEKEQTKWYEDPLGWLQNQFSLPYDYAAYNSHADQANMLENKMSSIMSLTSSETQSQLAIAQTSTAATAQAAADAAKAKADAAAQQVKMSGLRYNIEGIQAIAGMNQDQITNTVTGIRTMLEGQQVQIQEQYRALQGAMYQEKVRVDQAYLAQATQNQAADKDLADTINQGRAAMGFTNPLPPARILNMLKAGGALGAQMQQFYTVGSIKISTGKAVLAGSPAQAATALLTIQPPESAPEKVVTDMITNELLDSRRAALQKGVKDPLQIDQAANGKIDALVDGMGSNIQAGDYRNIYHAPTLDALQKSVPGITRTPLWKTVVAPLVANGAKVTDANQLLGFTVDAVRAGKINANQAAKDLSSIFSGVVASNNANRQYQKYGIMPQSSFNTKVDTGLPGIISADKTTIDMTQQTQVQNMISKMLSNQQTMATVYPFMGN